MKTFAAWYIDMPWQTAILFSLAIFIGICLLILWIDAWLEGAETRAIKRKRRRERKLLAKTRAMLLRRHDSAADRDCFREVHR